MSLLLQMIIRAYQLMISPWIAPSCRFQPTCSQYALDGLKQSGIKAIPLIIKRIGKCHPFGASGYDPFVDPSVQFAQKTTEQNTQINQSNIKPNRSQING